MAATKAPYVGGELNNLADKVPLRTPYSITFSTCNICDFHCSYCDVANVTPEQKKERGYRPYIMPLQKFMPFVQQLAQFEDSIKQVAFVSHGETILNPELPDMVRLVKETGKVQAVKITTNGNKLTPEFSDQLVASGLDVLKVSLQGLSDKRYRQVCNADVDFKKLLGQLRYFYEHRKQCRLYIKIIDVALESKDQEDAFYQLFGPIADNVFIERCFNESGEGEMVNKTAMNVAEMETCPMPFYTMTVDERGDVSPCCRTCRLLNGEQAVMGNLYKKTLRSLWENEFYDLQIRLLKQTLNEDSICFGCHKFYSVAKDLDILDLNKDRILNRYEIGKTV